MFVDSVRNNLGKDPKNGYDTAIKECMQNNILKEYLTRKSKEVHNMLLSEYDYETDMEVRWEEAYECGIEQGIEQGTIKTASSLKNMGISSSQITQATGLSIEEIEQL